jgi:phospholipid/cholesterol/gamma-HCH transport system substrate-binding protein/paraquat-inducible protein B
MESVSYFKIGLFVITAIIIGVIGVVALGGAKFLQKKNIIETYIDESVQGLDAGSAVKFRGVQVGNVEEITLTSVEYPTQRSYVLVRASVSRNVFHFPLSDPDDPAFKADIQKGLRVRLAPQGLTGQAYLEVDYVDPSQNPPLVIDWQPNYPYIPSARSRITQFSDAIERILRNIEQVDIQRLTSAMENSLKTIDKLAGSVNFDQIGGQVNTLLSELRATNGQLREIVDAPELKSAIKDASLAASTARQILERADKPLTKLINDLPKTSEGINRLVQRLDSMSADLPETSAQARETVQRLNRLIVNQQRDIEKTVENLRAVSENMKEITEDSKRYPAQTLFGAPPPPAKAMGR